MKIIGIDLGLTGAMVVYDPDIKTIETAMVIPTRSVRNKRVRDKKTKKMKWTYKKEYDALPIGSFLHSIALDTHAVLEPITAFPMKGPGGENRMSFGRLAEGFGGFKFLLETFCIPYLLAHPRVWKTHMEITSDFIDFEKKILCRIGVTPTLKDLNRLIGIEKKNASVNLVLKMMVEKKLTVLPDVKIDHNMADAILLAIYKSEIKGEDDGKE